MNYATVCSGVEAMSLAVDGMGWKPVFFSEIEPFPCKLLATRFPSVPNLGDMTKIEGEKYAGSVDILAGGTPCQSFSVAGKRGGLNDGRGGLMLNFVRLAYETGARYVAWENVPGCLSSGKGEDFAALLSCLCGVDVPVPAKGWKNSGVVVNAPGCYGVAWRVLDAQFTRVPGFEFAVPQRRRRVWLVGYLGDWRRAAEVLFVGEGLPWDFAPGEREGQEVTGGVKGGSGKASGIEVSPTEIKSTDVSATIDCRCKNGPVQNQVGTAVIHCMAHVQANAEIMQDQSPTLSCNHEQPIITCASKQQSQNIGVDVANALGANDYKEPQVVCYENHANDSRVTDSGNLSPTITSRAGTGGGNLPLVKVEPIATSDVVHGDKACNGKGWNAEVFRVTFNDANGTRKDRPNGGCYVTKAEVSGTLTQADSELKIVQMDTMATQGVCVPFKDVADCIVSSIGTKWNGNAPATNGSQFVKTHNLVRRLTVLECERLMAFPDGWTDIRPNGKPTPDSPRYKACGNSWAVNCARFVMMRIQQSEDKYSKKDTL